MKMENEKIRETINKLLRDIEEEDIGISLFTTHYQNSEELEFFSKEDKARVIEILKRLSEESRSHKEILAKIIEHLGKLYREE